jgi:polar amino acid transport system ATP-binding protein
MLTADTKPDKAFDARITAGETPVISLVNVSKSFGSFRAIEDMNLSIRPQEKVVIIGPSGSAKTTVLRLMMTLETPTDGRVEFEGQLLGCGWKDGKAIAKNPDIRKLRSNIGMVFQQFNLFPHLTAIENVMESLIYNQKKTKDEAYRIAEEMFARVGMQLKNDSYPAQLSGGQQQRVAVARALVLHPTLMLFDEVTSALDPESVGEILRLIRDLAKEINMGMVIVTHEMDFARKIADRVVFMDQGKIVEIGPPEDLLDNPTNPRTIKFLNALAYR